MGRALTIVLIGGLAVSMVVSTGTPVPVGVVDSDSMAPTLEPGDRFLALPPGLVGGASVGDVVVFHAADGWTVHRVVGTTEAGFLTAGDANPLTDQSDGAPAVSPAAIAGVVPSVAGRPIVLPEPSTLAWVVALLGLGLVGWWRRPRRRLSPPRPGAIGVLVAATVIVGWFVRGGLRSGRSVGAVRNDGPLPMVLVDVAASGDINAVLWPGEVRHLDDPQGIGIVPGWVPSAVLQGVDRPVLIVGVAAITMGGTATLIAAAVHRFLPPIEDR